MRPERPSAPRRRAWRRRRSRALIAGQERRSSGRPRRRTSTRLLLTLRDAKGAVLESCRRCRLPQGRDQGRPAARQRRPILFKGVNRHEIRSGDGQDVRRRHDARHPADEAVQHQRGAHVATTPTRPALVPTVRSVRPLLMDEANIETHGYGYAPQQPADEQPGVDAGCTSTAWSAWSSATRTIRRSSSGRWATSRGDGMNVAAVYQWTSARSARPVHNEGSTSHGRLRTPTSTRSCIRARQSLEGLAAQEPDRPLILCEYAHTMGNSNGGLRSTGTSSTHTNAQGAFMWDWVDRASGSRSRRIQDDRVRLNASSRTAARGGQGRHPERQQLRHERPGQR